MFLNYQPTQQIINDNSIYADAVNHCKAYKEYLVAGSITSSVHEITHRINADIRNGALIPNQNSYIYDTGLCKCSMMWPNSNERENAFYVLENRAIKIKEPNSRKQDCIKHIPNNLRGHRYGLYVAGQSTWDDRPLYIFDEWVAYTNGAACVIDLFKRNQYKDGNTDYIYGPVEFIAYGIATLMAAPELSDTLIDFSKWLLDRVFDLYFRGITLLPWPDADKTYSLLLGNNHYKSFLKDKLNYTIPSNNDDIDYRI